MILEPLETYAMNEVASAEVSNLKMTICRMPHNKLQHPVGINKMNCFIKYQ